MHSPPDDFAPDATLSSRVELMVAVTAQVLRDDVGLTFCEALRLVDAARNAVSRRFPDAIDTFDRFIRPRLDAIIEQRFGLAPPRGPN